MSLLIVNPGYAEYVASTAYTTVRDNFTYSPLTGVSFTKTNPTATPAEILLPNSGSILRFSWWQGTQPDIFKWRGNFMTYYVDANGKTQGFPTTFTLTLTSSEVSFGYSYKVLVNSGVSTRTWYPTRLLTANEKALNTFYMHANGNHLILSHNGETIDYQLSAGGVDDAPPIFEPMNRACSFDYTSSSVNLTGDDKTYFSEFILADDDLPPDPRVLPLPAGNIETNMASVEGGFYTPQSGDPTWWMTPNITPLLESHLSSTKVYGLAVGANPCQITASTTFTALSKSEGTVTEHDTVTVNPSRPGFLDYWLTENTTLGDLANIQLGLKSGE